MKTIRSSVFTIVFRNGQLPLPGEGIVVRKAMIKKIHETGYCRTCNFEFGYPKGYIPGLKDYQHAFNVIKTRLQEWES